MSKGELAGKVAVVTGASRGIGRAIAMAMAREGADLVATARSTERLQELAGEVTALDRSCLVVTADMTVEEEVRGIAAQAVAEFGRVDVLVNNAGMIYPKTNLVDFDFGVWREVMEVNLLSVVALCHAVLPVMISQSAGKIINLSSIGGKHPNAGQTPYKASKAAIINFTGCLAAEVKQHGIDVTCICPGGVDTDGFRELFGARGSGKFDPMSARVIAELALFLASDASGALTGTSIDAFGLSSPIFR
ncbi:MAG: SDR family oxidoreductase [Actinobacteria bacterium]|nr:SDR family oxidoreductase [Actinomycetota bacterium]